MDRIDMEWIDKLFSCMEQFFGNRWTKRYDQFYPISLAKTLWQSALHGYSHEDIRRALVLLKQVAKNPAKSAPLHLEFYQYVDAGRRAAAEIEKKTTRGDPEIARKAIDDIKKRLNTECTINN